MLLEDLKTLEADLIKQSEEAVPIIGDGDKKEWMANRLENIMDEDGEALQCLLRFNLRSDVIDYLEKEYNERNDEDRDPGLPCDTYLAENDVRTSGRENPRNQNFDKTGINPDDDEPVLIIEEDVLIIRDKDDCGC